MKTGIKFKGCNVAQSDAHNRRDKAYTAALQAKYKRVHYREDLFDQNSRWVNPKYEHSPLWKLLEKAKREAKEKTGRKMQDKALPIREGCPPIKATTRPSDFARFVEWLESKGIDVISITLHKDEGHYDPKSLEWVPNYHAHIVCDWFDHTTGKAIRLTPNDCKQMQTVLAESLGMERGTPKEDTGIEALSALEWKEQQTAKSVSSLTLEEKNLKEMAEVIREEIKDLKDEKAAIEERLKSLNTSAATKEKLLGLLGQSSKDKTIEEQRTQIQTLQANLKLQRENHAEELEKVRKSGRNAVAKALRDLVQKTGLPPLAQQGRLGEALNFSLDSVINAVNALKEKLNLYIRDNRDLTEENKTLKRQLSQDSTRDIHLKR